ncbi:hypothetical protein N0V83_005014 [Neocucurbitaria cava]|uniref:F-box domain-containing protein n=1 Tax=Neocucurbitaria cava TaxID=798079 RepID=A0A9W8YB34_9PLEO|nr:hypothetical protein N0V83_005014 [Neocucurbitaria cava]
MDVSSGRHAIAMLLEGRLGMVCELCYGRRAGKDGPFEVHVESNGLPCRTTPKSSILASHNSDSQEGIDLAECTAAHIRRSFPYIQERDLGSLDRIGVRSNYQETILQGTNEERNFDRNLINQTWNLNLGGGPLDASRYKLTTNSAHQGIPIDSGTSTFYRHICSEDDPPRSVSICPQRRCVAFGCSAGIELHWIDALTGQSLSRCFPLTAPSDYLHFLSPRPGLESAKKLRLISSAAHPDDQLVISSPPSPSCDHYHAVPLSDGHHVLFIDPANNKLTLGCDAPINGPRKLLRRVVFIPPGDLVVPKLYTAAADMSQGLRVIAAYDDAILLYSIPSDVCNLSRLERKAESPDLYTASPSFTETHNRNYWFDWWDEPSVPDPADQYNSDKRDPVWPISIRGTYIGKLSGVCELAIQTTPDISIWAFSYAFQCKIWRLHNHADPIALSRRYICNSGLVHESFSTDETSDVIMEDAPEPPPIAATFDPVSQCSGAEISPAERSVIVGMDEDVSKVLRKVPRALAVENDEWVDFLDVRDGSEAWFEGDGDVFVWYGT